MAIEIVDFPIKNGDFPVSYVNVYQRVIHYFTWVVIFPLYHHSNPRFDQPSPGIEATTPLLQVRPQRKRVEETAAWWPWDSSNLFTEMIIDDPNKWEAHSKCLTGWWCNVPILKNDGVRQWEGWHPIYYGNIMENKKCSKPPTS